MIGWSGEWRVRFCKALRQTVQRRWHFQGWHQINRRTQYMVKSSAVKTLLKLEAIWKDLVIIKECTTSWPFKETNHQDRSPHSPRRQKVVLWTSARGRSPMHSLMEWETELKKHFLMGSDTSLNEVFNQSLNLQAAKVVTIPPVRPWEVTRVPLGTWLPLAKERSVCWQRRITSEETVSRDVARRSEPECQRSPGVGRINHWVPRHFCNEEW
jgi:hypothetical protein